jgi:hypothetical protein
VISIRLIRDGKVLAERKLLETSLDYPEITRAIFSAASNGGVVRADEAFWWFFLRNPEMLNECILECISNGEKIRLRVIGGSGRRTGERTKKVLR